MRIEHAHRNMHIVGRGLRPYQWDRSRSRRYLAFHGVSDTLACEWGVGYFSPHFSHGFFEYKFYSTLSVYTYWEYIEY